MASTSDRIDNVKQTILLKITAKNYKSTYFNLIKFLYLFVWFVNLSFNFSQVRLCPHDTGTDILFPRNGHVRIKVTVTQGRENL